MAGFIKVVLLGDGGVGKTALRLRYMGIGFQTSYLSTIGADFALKEVKAIHPLKNTETNVKLQIWDLAGQQHYSKIRGNYYFGTNGALIVFDVSRRSSFDNIGNWIAELKKNVQNSVPIIIIANKIDLRDTTNNPNYIHREEGERIANKIMKEYDIEKVFYLETSAKLGEGVQQAFLKITTELLTQLEK